MDECGRLYGIAPLYGLGSAGRTDFHLDIGALAEDKRIGPASSYVPYFAVERSIVVVACPMMQ